MSLADRGTILPIIGRLPLPIYMTRKDPSRNMAQFYVIALAPTLFGEVSFVRNLGRIGSSGQMMVETFPSANAALEASDRLARAKRHKGNHPPALMFRRQRPRSEPHGSSCPLPSAQPVVWSRNEFGHSLHESATVPEE